MAQDTTYQGAIRRLQGNNVLEVGSTGQIDNYGKIRNLTNGYVQEQTESQTGNSTDTGVSLSAYGASFLSTTGTTGARALFRLPKPAAVGQRKTIYATNASTAKTAVIETTGTGILFGTTNSTSHGSYKSLTMNDPEDSVELIGISATAWGITSNVGSVSLSTVFTA